MSTRGVPDGHPDSYKYDKAPWTRDELQERLSKPFLAYTKGITKLFLTYMAYHANVGQETALNDNFRKVLYTGLKSQLVVMDIPPGGEIGEEVHEYVEQTLFFQSGSGIAVVDGQESPVAAGEVFVVPPGARHNFRNNGAEALKVYTVYAPPNHIDGRVHKAKADADADAEDEAFGHAAR